MLHSLVFIPENLDDIGLGNTSAIDWTNPLSTRKTLFNALAAGKMPTGKDYVIFMLFAGHADHFGPPVLVFHYLVLGVSHLSDHYGHCRRAVIDIFAPSVL